MELFAYFDESGTHAGSMISTMAGYISERHEWDAYQDRAAQLFRQFDVHKFHAIDVRRGHGSFIGWPVNRKIEFLDEFQNIINVTLKTGVSAFISEAAYQYYLTQPSPPKIRKDTKYTLMFRACAAYAVCTFEGVNIIAEPRLHIKLEQGHKNAKDALRCYENIRQATPEASTVLASMSFADKEQSLQLAAADLLAYTTWGHRVGQKPIGTPPTAVKSDISYTGNVSYIDLDRATLDELVKQAASHVAKTPSNIT